MGGLDRMLLTNSTKSSWSIPTTPGSATTPASTGSAPARWPTESSEDKPPPVRRPEVSSRRDPSLPRRDLPSEPLGDVETPRSSGDTESTEHSPRSSMPSYIKQLKMAAILLAFNRTAVLICLNNRLTLKKK